MNILINKYCNLQCEYCFANNMLNEKSIPNDMSIEDFRYCLNFLKKSGENRIKILGGEPTLSRYFSDYCNEIIKEDYFSEVYFFSNGLMPSEAIENLLKLSKVKKIFLIINLNNEKYLGYKYIDLKNNLKVLNRNLINIIPGINIYDSNTEYNYIIELAKELNLKLIRWSIVAPNEKTILKYHPIEYYKKYVNIILKFLAECHSKNIETRIDCNVIPKCIFTDEQIKQLMVYENTIFERKRCIPVNDVLPNLNVIRCFNTINEISCSLKEFENLDNLERFMKLNVDNKVNGKIFSSGCLSCDLHSNFDCSCGCLLFHI